MSLARKGLFIRRCQVGNYPWLPTGVVRRNCVIFFRTEFVLPSGGVVRLMVVFALCSVDACCIRYCPLCLPLRRRRETRGWSFGVFVFFCSFFFLVRFRRPFKGLDSARTSRHSSLLSSRNFLFIRVERALYWWGTTVRTLDLCRIRLHS